MFPAFVVPLEGGFCAIGDDEAQNVTEAEWGRKTRRPSDRRLKARGAKTAAYRVVWVYGKEGNSHVQEDAIESEIADEVTDEAHHCL